MTKEGPTTRVVQIDARRAVAEILEQLYIREIESTWINEIERYNSLKDDKETGSTPKYKHAKAAELEEVAVVPVTVEDKS